MKYLNTLIKYGSTKDLLIMVGLNLVLTGLLIYNL